MQHSDGAWLKLACIPVSVSHDVFNALILYLWLLPECLYVCMSTPMDWWLYSPPRCHHLYILSRLSSGWEQGNWEAPQIQFSGSACFVGLSRSGKVKTVHQGPCMHGTWFTDSHAPSTAVQVHIPVYVGNELILKKKKKKKRKSFVTPARKFSLVHLHPPRSRRVPMSIQLRPEHFTHLLTCTGIEV